MKSLLVCALMALAAIPGRAQLFTPESLGGAALGGLAGGIIGHNHHRQTAEGAAIGAGAGLLLGSLFHQARHHDRPRPAYRHHHDDHFHPAPSNYHRHSYRAYPRHSYRARSRPNYAVGGVLLGGLAGGIIGHNHHRQTAEGIAIGAGAGLLLGGLTEYHARQHEGYYEPRSPAYLSAPAMRYKAEPPPLRPVQITVFNFNNSPSPRAMDRANQLFGR